MPFLSDTFTEASDTALGSHTPDVGGTWTVFAGAMTVIGSEDRARGDSSSSSGAAYNSASPASDQYDVEAVVRRTTSDANPLCGIYARYDSAGPHYVQMYMSQPDSLLVMQEVQSGAVVESSTYSKTWTVDTNYAFKIEARTGSNGVKGYLDGTQRVQITWSGGSTPGKAGVRARLYGRVDSLVATDYSSAVDLVVADITHGHPVDALALTQDHQLAVAEATHAHLIDGLALAQQHQLAVADATHAHPVDALDLTQLHQLVVQDATHAHPVDALALIQTHLLALAHCLHAHAVDHVDLSGVVSLAIADCLHGHLADGITLGTSTTLVIADVLHAHAADAVALGQVHVMVVNDAVHAQLVDSLALSLPGAVLAGERALVVPAENRVLVIVAESRALAIAAEIRALTVH